MSTYILLANYTAQGIGTIKESPGRVHAARDIAKSCGAEIKDVHLTMGAYDIVMTIEASSDEAMAKFALALGSLGNLRTTSLRAFEESEFRDIVGALPID